MKQQYNFILSITILLCLIAGGCKEDNEFIIPQPSDVEIMPKASVNQTRSDLAGAQDGPGFPASTDNVFAISAFLSSDDIKDHDHTLNGEDKKIDIKYFLNQPLKTDASGQFHFYSENGMRYYPEDGSHLYFYAFSPACAVQDANNPKLVSWNLTGQEDIMYAKDLRGISKISGDHIDGQIQPEFKFKHLLTRLNFRCRRETGFADYIYITGITIKNQRCKAQLDLDLGKLSFSDNKEDKKDMSTECNHMIDVVVDYKNILSVFVEPCESYDIEVALKNGTTITFTINAPAIEDDNNYSKKFQPGYFYDVNLRFQGTGFDIDVKLNSWNDGGTSSGIILPSKI